MNDKKIITFKLNGENRTFEISPHEKLLDLLRRSGFTGTKHGCGDGACGACTVILDGCSVNSCITYAFQAHEREVETIEGVGDFEHPHDFQKNLVETGGVQCGYCIPGIVMSTKALLDEIPNPSHQEIMENLDGNFCRCTGYEKIEEALQRTISESVKEKIKWQR